MSEGCRNCYAERVAYRFSGDGRPYEGLAKLVNGHAAWTGKVSLVENHLLDPLRWKVSRKIFVNSMSDLFHENVPDQWIDRIFAVMALCPQHTFQVLTKRPTRMCGYFEAQGLRHSIAGAAADILVELRRPRPTLGAAQQIAKTATKTVWDPWPLPNVWLGVSVENQAAADERIPLLLQTPAVVRFISAEPLLGAVNIGVWLGTDIDPSDDNHEYPGLDWVICGGESGSGARPMHPDWARSLRDQCQAAGVPFFFKQWGEWAPIQYVSGGKPFLKISVPMRETMKDSTREIVWNDVNMRLIGKKAAGALLDGCEWKEFPQGGRP